jgi:hypothetical protein
LTFLVLFGSSQKVHELKKRNQTNRRTVNESKQIEEQKIKANTQEQTQKNNSEEQNTEEQ